MSVVQSAGNTVTALKKMELQFKFSDSETSSSFSSIKQTKSSMLRLMPLLARAVKVDF